MKIKAFISILFSILGIVYSNAQVSTNLQNKQKIQPSVNEKIDSCKLILKIENPKFAIYYQKTEEIYSIESNFDNIDTNFISDIRVMSREQYKRLFGKSIDEVGVIEVKYLCDTFKSIPQIVRPYHTSYVSYGKVKELTLKEKKYEEHRNKKYKRMEQKQKREKERMRRDGELITPLVKVTFKNEKENDSPFLLIDMKERFETRLKKIEIEKDQVVNVIIDLSFIREKDGNVTDVRLSANSATKDKRMVEEVYRVVKASGSWAKYAVMRNTLTTYYEMSVELIF